MFAVLSKTTATRGYDRIDRSSISPRKQLWIKAVKKLTSERLGREGLAAWENRENRKSNNDSETDEAKDASASVQDDEAEETEAEAEDVEQPVPDEEAQIHRGMGERVGLRSHRRRNARRVARGVALTSGSGCNSGTRRVR